MGGQNCHLDIEFDDGVVWLARIRLDDPTFPPNPVQEHILVSEFSTLKFLEKVDIPTPKAFQCSIESSENIVGVSYILMEKMRGSALDWNGASKEQRTKVIEQLADIFLELQKHPFEATGSLTSESEIGGFAQSLLFRTPTSPLGPFKSFRSSLESIVRHQLALISDEEISSLNIDNYLSFCWRLDMIPHLLSSADDRGPFYLKHMDDKGDHILVDEDYNITAIIDWESASTEVQQVAFGSPCMLWPVGKFYEGKNVLTQEELELASVFQRRGRTDMAMNVLKGRALQRFLFFLGGASNDQAEFEALFQGLRSAMLGPDTDDQGLVAVGSYEEWRKKALAQYSKDDRWLQKRLDTS